MFLMVTFTNVKSLTLKLEKCHRSTDLGVDGRFFKLLDFLDCLEHFVLSKIVAVEIPLIKKSFT